MNKNILAYQDATGIEAGDGYILITQTSPTGEEDRVQVALANIDRFINGLAAARDAILSDQD